MAHPDGAQVSGIIRENLTPMKRRKAVMICPECAAESLDEYCPVCFTLLDRQYIRERKNQWFAEWAKELESALEI